jgi:hypothetical protein
MLTTYLPPLDRRRLQLKRRTPIHQHTASRLPVHTRLSSPERPGAPESPMHEPRIHAVRPSYHSTSISCSSPPAIANKPQNVLLDMYIFILPISILASLQMPTRRKIAVISVFLFGGASVLMSIIRFHSLANILKSLNVASRYFGEIIIVAALELNLATIAVNLPAMRSIWVKGHGSQRSAVSSGARNGISMRKTYTVTGMSAQPSAAKYGMGRAESQSPRLSTFKSVVSQFPYMSLNRDRDEEKTGAAQTTRSGTIMRQTLNSPSHFSRVLFLTWPDIVTRGMWQMSGHARAKN